MRILHLIRRLDDSYPLDVAAVQAHTGGAEVEVVYLQDAVYRPPATGFRTYVLDQDARARNVDGRHEALSYERLVDLIFAADRVLSW